MRLQNGESSCIHTTRRSAVPRPMAAQSAFLSAASNSTPPQPRSLLIQGWVSAQRARNASARQAAVLAAARAVGEAFARSPVAAQARAAAAAFAGPDAAAVLQQISAAPPGECGGSTLGAHPPAGPKATPARARVAAMCVPDPGSAGTPARWRSCPTASSSPPTCLPHRRRPRRTGRRVLRPGCRAHRARHACRPARALCAGLGPA